MFETNQNKAERVLRALLAAVLLPAPLVSGESPYTFACAGVGAVLLFNAISGACMTYRAFGVNTCRIPEKTED